MCHPGFPTYIMVRETPMAIYGFPMEEDERFPMCLVFFSPYSLIGPLGEMMDLCVDLEQSGEFMFRLQIKEE